MKSRLLCGVCVLAGLTLAASAADLSAFAKRIRFTVRGEEALAGASVADLPVLVRLSTEVDGFDYADFRLPKGGDMLFVDADGKAIPHEIDTWNPDGESLVWVKVPSVRTGVWFAMYYGNGVDTADMLSAESPWSGYRGVWHLGEADGTAFDATENHLDATPTGFNGASTACMVGVEGAVGTARYNSDAEGTHRGLVVPSSSALDMNGTLTMSGWFRSDAAIAGWPRIAARRAEGNGWEIELDRYDSAVQSSLVTAFADGAGDWGPLNGAAEGQWAHIVVAYSAGQVSIYVNGELKKLNKSFGTVTDEPCDLVFGCNTTGSEGSLAGAMDELRLAPSAYDAVRVSAEYATVKDRAFLSASAARPVQVRLEDYAKRIRFIVRGEETLAGGSVADLPVLVRLSTALEGFDYADFELSGDDMVFVDAAGKVIPHEIDTWNPDGESLVWVKVPSVRTGAWFTMYYGNGMDPSPSLSAGNPWSGYRGVWHLGEAFGQAYDATTNRLDATPRHFDGGTTTCMTNVTGAVGAARYNSDAEGARRGLVVPSSSALDMNGTLTVSGWFRADAKIVDWPRIAARRQDSKGWEIEVDRDGILDCSMTAWADTAYAQGLGFDGIVGQWAHIAVVFTPEKMSCYVNGKLNCASFTAGPLTDEPCDLVFGCNSTGTESSFAGAMDELRLSTSAADALRVKAEYATVADTAFLDATPARPVKFATFEDFAKRIRFTVRGEEALAGGSVADMPVLVRLSTALTGFDYADFELAGGDMLFVDADGQALPHEIDTWNPNGESLVWVKVPSVRTGARFTMYYGNGIDPWPTVTIGNPWSGYRGVWHLGEAAGQAYDATTNRLDATPTHFGGGTTTCMTNVAGAVGAARYNSNSEGTVSSDSHRGLVVPSSSALDMNGTLTLSGWFRSDAAIANWPRIAARRLNEKGWEIELDRSSEYGGQWTVWADGVSDWGPLNNAVVGQWAHIAVSYSPDQVAFYVNGELKKTSRSLGTVTDQDCNLVFGCNSTGEGAWSFAGAMDEIRLAPTAADAVRVRAEYATVADRTFLRASAAKPPVSEGFSIIVR